MSDQKTGLRRRPLVARLEALAAVTLLLASCAGSGDDDVGGDDTGPVAWDALENPVIAQPGMTKDVTVARVDGDWLAYFSEQPAGEGPPQSLVSDDLAGWEPGPRWFSEAEGNPSPDLTRAPDGTWVLAYQHQMGDDAELFYRTAVDPVAGPWSPPRPLAPGIFDERVIDPALAFTDHGTFLFLKRGERLQVPQVATVLHSPDGSLDGPWQLVGDANVGWTENFQLLDIDGTWHLVLTEVPVHVPALWRLTGDPAEPRAWLTWDKVTTFDVPQEAWNRGETPGTDHETANAAYLSDLRAVDGHFYLFYAGSTELDRFDGRGHAKIGVARSSDLRSWKVPPGPGS